MRTVKEISVLTGISVRALHYYDEIGLLKPTKKSEAGYRLYDDKALETLQQILFFREFDIPLKEIKAITDNLLDDLRIIRPLFYIMHCILPNIIYFIIRYRTHYLSRISDYQGTIRDYGILRN